MVDGDGDIATNVYNDDDDDEDDFEYYSYEDEDSDPNEEYIDNANAVELKTT